MDSNTKREPKILDGDDTAMGDSRVYVVTSSRNVGLFVKSRDAGVLLLLFYTGFCNVVKIVETVAFIRTLLFIAGVEPNPGPEDERFIFRYQYLLIEVGTKVIRKLFDNIVGNDFVNFLTTRPGASKRLQFLIDRNVINEEQKKILPPIETTPNSSNFDLTLLACLLRNLCGLRGSKDPVWTNPLPGDLSVEAQIARLRLCRNWLQHIKTVYISKSEFNLKWNELVDILQRLNNDAKLSDLASLILDAQQKDIDDELRKKLDEALEALKVMDEICDGIEELKRDVSEIKGGQSRLEESLSELRENQSAMMVDQSSIVVCLSELNDNQSVVMESLSSVASSQSELKEVVNNLGKKVENLEQKPQEQYTSVKDRLKTRYMESCSTLQLTPLYREDDEIDLLTIYQLPDMCHLPYHRDHETDAYYAVSSYKQLFERNGKSFRNIYITGNVGVGKTSFCRRMALLWSKWQSGFVTDNDTVQEDIAYMEKFSFVFYISLRDTCQVDIVEMIIDHFFYTCSKDNREEMIKLIENILQRKKCLIILDGLDEWTPTACGNKDNTLPRRIISDSCTYLTSCRPHKIENVRLSSKQIDCQVQMTGILKKSSVSYVQEIVNFLNKVKTVQRNPHYFFRDVNECGLSHLLCIPIIASQLVVVWSNKSLSDMSRSLIYGNIIEMLFERAQEKERNEMMSAAPSGAELPVLFAELRYMKMNVSLLEKLCFLSFQALFQQRKHASVLVFTEKDLASFSINDENVDTLCKFGVISKNKIIGDFARREQKLSFSHESYPEFLAALFVSTFDKNNLFRIVVGEWTSIDDLLQHSNFFIFLAGFCFEKVKESLKEMYLKISDELDTYRKDISSLSDNILSNKLKLHQNCVIECYKEACRSNVQNITLKLEDYIFARNTDNDSLLKLLSLNRSCVKTVYIGSDNFSLLSSTEKTFSYIDLFNYIKNSQIESLHICDCYHYKSNYDTMNTLTCTVKSLLHIKSLELWDVNLLNDVLLVLNPAVTCVKIKLYEVTMSRQCFHSFIESFVNNESVIKVEIFGCRITSVDSGAQRILSIPESLRFMSEYLKTKPTIKITSIDDSWLLFNTKIR